MNAIGVTLLAAAIVAPAISARMLTNNFLKMVTISTIIGIATSFLGMYASFYFDSASGATIVLFGAGSIWDIITLCISEKNISYTLAWRSEACASSYSCTRTSTPTSK